MAEGTVAADQLRLFIERIERLEEEKKGIADDVKDVYAEAKSSGYDPKIMRMISKRCCADSPSARKRRQSNAKSGTLTINRPPGTRTRWNSASAWCSSST